MHIHILGICGTFMGGLAALARAAGHRVTGCDTGVYPPMSEQLRALGIDVIEGYGADQTALRPDVYVVGNVVSRARLAGGAPKFPLMEAVLDSGAPYTSGPQWLAEHILRPYHVLAVAGTHGKTTTSAMLAWVLECAGCAPGFLIGGVPLNFNASARLGGQPGKDRPLFVIEADEYDTAFFDKRSKFLHYRARTLVLNNLEFDHADIFDDLRAIERQFHHLLRTVPASGQIIVNAQEPHLARVLHQGCYSAVCRFGGVHADYGSDDATAQDSPHGSTFDVLHQGRKTGRVRWQLGGAHNRLNALAAIAAAAQVGVSAAQACEALADFAGVKRRMQLCGSAGGVAVYDDFAHHPTAMRATLDGLRRQLQAPHGKNAASRILAVFEPRSNTMQRGHMKAQLPDALRSADLVFCHSGALDWDAAEALRPLGQRARTARDVDTLLAHVRAAARAGDHVVCMSNGSFDNIHSRLLAALQEDA